MSDCVTTAARGRSRIVADTETSAELAKAHGWTVVSLKLGSSYSPESVGAPLDPKMTLCCDLENEPAA